jgi:DNA-binding XRE family transcriptional regulator
MESYWKHFRALTAQWRDFVYCAMKASDNWRGTIRVIAGIVSLRVLGAEIRTLREAKGLSQERVAAIAGLHRNFIGLIERGQRNPTFLTLVAISTKLGLPLSELMEGAGKWGR